MAVVTALFINASAKPGAHQAGTVFGAGPVARDASKRVEMNRFGRPAYKTTDGEAASAAESVRNDFNQLIRVFDHQLRQLSGADPSEQLHIEEAKAAAERGLRLSQQLIEMLRPAD